MSLVEKEISSVVGGSGGGGGRVVGDDGDDDDGESRGSGSGGSHCRCTEQKAKKQRGFSGGGLSRNFGKAKQVVLHPFGRSKKQLPRKAKARASASGACFALSKTSGKMFGGGGGNAGGNKSCYFCFTQPDSPVGSQTSDPEHPSFTFGMLRAFVESNEFYSKDCNPHLDIDVSPYKMD